MSARIVEVKPDSDYRLWIRFADGLAGSVTLANLLDLGAFKHWRDVRIFLTARPDRETGNVVWPAAGIQLDRDILHDAIEAEGGNYGPPPVDPSDPHAPVDPGFYRFMASALSPVKLTSPRRKRK